MKKHLGASDITQHAHVSSSGGIAKSDMPDPSNTDHVSPRLAAQKEKARLEKLEAEKRRLEIDKVEAAYLVQEALHGLDAINNRLAKSAQEAMRPIIERACTTKKVEEPLQLVMRPYTEPMIPQYNIVAVNPTKPVR